jgi:transcriptional regulator with XRE-family HTH domain
MNKKPFSQLRNQITPNRQKNNQLRAKAELVNLALQELRQSLNVTQQELATRLEITQPALSKLEHQGDMHLSTLYRVIECLGGELKLVVSFPEQEDIILDRGNLVTQPAKPTQT